MQLGVAMEREIRAQPDVLASNSDRYLHLAQAAVGNRSFEMIVLVARGSSDNAALYARYLFEVFLGTPCVLAAPSVLTRFGRKLKYHNALGIGISQSGAGPDVAEVIAAMRSEGHATLAITNTPDSRLAAEAHHILALDAGTEQSVAATKTYSASLLALYQTARALGADLPEPDLPDPTWVDVAEQAAQDCSGLIVRSNPTFAIGRGFSFSTAQETALKLMESALIACKPYSSADFEHGPKALAGPGSAAVSFVGPLEGLTGQGCAIARAPTPHGHNATGEPSLPMWDVIFGQWLALLAARARGLDPDHPAHLSKVTKTL